MFQVAIVVGGGNIFRGSSWAGSSGLDRSSADYIGYFLKIDYFFLLPNLIGLSIHAVHTAFIHV